MSTNVTLKANGLNFSPNQLEVPEGSLTEAKNVVIRRQNVVEKRRGFSLYGNTFGTANDRLKQLLEYRNRLIRHYNDTLQYDNGSGTFTSFTGSYSEPDTNLKIKSVVSNNNLYFTSSDGIKKISSASSNLSPDMITSAGGIKAIDLTASPKYQYGLSSGFLPINSVVNYRVVWGTKDANNNLVLGTPSSQFQVYNFGEPVLVQDLMHLLGALDNVGQNAGAGELLTDTNYVSSLGLGINAVGTDIWTNLKQLATKIDEDLLYAEQASANPMQITGVVCNGTETIITVSGATATNYLDIGSKIFLKDFTLTNKTLTFDANSATDVSTTADRITINNHGLVTGDTVSLTATGNLPTGLIANTTYYIINPTINNFQLSLTPSGSVVDITALAGAASTATVNITKRGNDINGAQVVTAVTATTITFLSNAYADVTITGSKIESNTYRSIEAPEEPNPEATGQQILQLQTYMQEIITALQLENQYIISNASQTAYIEDLTITSTSTVTLDINIPEDVVNAGLNKYFVQIYRSSVTTANSVLPLIDLTASDELKQVYESFPTQTEFNNYSMTVEDIVPDSFAGSYLYTNASSGEGINQSNDIPPFAKDINRFKNVVFYANTRTRHKKLLSLLGITNIVSDIANNPSLTITDGINTDTYKFVLGVNEVSQVDFGTSGSINTLVSTANPASYFELTSSRTETNYYVWYKSGLSTDPAVPNKTGIQVIINSTDTNAVVAQKTANTLNQLPDDFTCELTSPAILKITQVHSGSVTDIAAGTMPVGYTVSTLTQGNGENASLKQVLLSNATSPAQALDETARSLVRVINQNPNSSIYAYYLSSASDVAGKLAFEKKTLDTNQFFLLASDDSVGQSFSPDLSPMFTGATASISNPAVITQTNHGLSTGDTIILSCVDGTSPSIDGKYTITKLTNNTFTIPINNTVIRTSISFSNVTDVEASENDDKQNRIYYSKKDQPEAVPAVNYFDVGASDKAIERIFPLRDSLFVFKEDGLYRVSGEISPFSLALFDSSCILIAPDSLGVSGNLIYGWTKQGISSVSEAGVNNSVSRPIDTQILRIGSSNFSNFKANTFGIGYESDNSYLIFTIDSESDSVSTLCYRFSNLTNTWTTYDIHNTCGLIKSDVDRIYLGSGIINKIEEERKTFTRADYADREFSTELLNGNYFGNQIILPNTLDYKIGDVFYQNQLLNTYQYNMTLKKIDLDPGRSSPVSFYDELKATGGADMRDKVVALADYLDNESIPIFNDPLYPGVWSNYTQVVDQYSGTITAASAGSTTIVTTSSPHKLFTGRYVTLNSTDSSPSLNGTWKITVINSTQFSIDTEVISAATTGVWSTAISDFRDITACYNRIIFNMNLSTGLNYSNYQTSDSNTELEAIIIDVNQVTKTITLNLALDFILGPVSVFESFESSITYCPTTFGDPISYKQIYEATAMFENKAFTSGTLSFASDLLPSYEDVNFDADSNGIYGNQAFGSGFFGGASHQAPFRTYVPRSKQYCRFLSVRFSHLVARENVMVFGISLTGRTGISTRAYKG